MKKIYILAAIALIAGVSCTKQVPADNNSPDLALSFNAVTGVQTKADITSANYPTTQDFDVWAVYTGDTDFAIATSGGEMFMSGIEQEYKADKKAWGTKTGAYYWPKAGKLTFWAVSPTGVSPTVGLTNATKTITKSDWAITNVDPDSNNDLMFSDIVANKTADDYKGHGVDDTNTTNDTGFDDYQGVNILFHHALSRIEFKAQRGSRVNTIEKLYLTNITVSNGLSTGTLTVTPTAVLSEGTPTSNFTAGDDKVVWSGQATPLDLTPLTSQTTELTTTPVVVGSDRLVIPQESTGVTFTVTVKSKIGDVEATKDYTYVLGSAHDGAWKWGKKYIYTLILNEDDIYFDPKVVDWDPVNIIFPDLVVLDKTHLEFTIGDADQTLVATVHPNTATDSSVTWSSSNDAVATVNNGTVHAVSAGTAIITVTTNTGALTATCVVTVTAAP